MIIGKKTILYLFLAAMLGFGTFSFVKADETQAQDEETVVQNEETVEQNEENQTAQRSATARRDRGPRYGMQLPTREEREAARAEAAAARAAAEAERAGTAPETQEERERRQVDPGVRFGMRLDPVEAQPEDEDDGVIRRVLDINDAADRAIMTFRDSVFAPPPPEQEAPLDFSHLTVMVDGRIRNDRRDSVSVSRMPRMFAWIGNGVWHTERPYMDMFENNIRSLNMGVGLLFPIAPYFGIKGEFSYMHTEFVDSAVGYRRETYAKLDTAAIFTLPISAVFMLRPGVFMFDAYVGSSFFNNKETVALMPGVSIGRRAGRNGYLFGDARFGFAMGERFRSFGIGYEYVPAFSRYDGGRRTHAIVAPADTFTIALRVNDEQGGLISPRGEHRVRGGHSFGFAAMANHTWALDSIIVNDTIYTGNIGSHTFNRVRNDLQILAMFTPPPPPTETYAIKILVLNPETGDTMAKQDFVVVAGEDKEINVSPQTGYIVSNLIINQTSVGSRERYTVRNIDRDISVKAMLTYVRPVIIREEATIQEGINFDVGTAELTDDSQRALAGIHYTMAENPNMIVEILGHTDNTGNRAFNMTLSQNRAQAVVDYLVARGIGAERLRAVGHGPDRPIADNATTQGRALNRRVEIRTIRSLEGDN